MEMAGSDPRSQMVSLPEYSGRMKLHIHSEWGSVSSLKVQPGFHLKMI